MQKKLIWKGAFLSLCLAAGDCFADLPDTQITIQNAPPGTVGLGFALRRGTSPYVGVENISSTLSDSKADLIPLYLYEGKWLFVHGTSAGVHLFGNDWLKIDALTEYRFDRLESDANDYLSGLHDRRQTIDGGLSVAVHGGWGTLSTTWVNDLLGNHNGSEWDLTYRYPWQSGRWSVSPFISYLYQDSDLTDYYYGVAVDEARHDRPAYQAGSAAFWRAGINTSYHFTRRLMLFSNIAFQQVDQEIYDSPLVDEEQLNSVTFGFAYLFGNVMDDSTKQNYSARAGEWSWRVNAGYQAQGTFHRTHRGHLERSKDLDAYVGGLTLGKLLADGRYLDYWGKLSLNRRFENNYQSDFWEYNAYVMAMTSIHSPWSHRELFRYGLGVGFSYASRVPYIEQVKQGKSDRNTSHFLNYLEAQLDVPLRLLFDSHAVKNCYVGMTLIHRSGVFANSDLLNNVAGGSDMVTAHVECKR